MTLPHGMSLSDAMHAYHQDRHARKAAETDQRSAPVADKPATFYADPRPMPEYEIYSLPEDFREKPAEWWYENSLGWAHSINITLDLGLTVPIRSTRWSLQDELNSALTSCVSGGDLVVRRTDGRWEPFVVPRNCFEELFVNRTWEAHW